MQTTWQHSPMEMEASSVNGKPAIPIVPETQITLEQMLAGVTEENRPDEFQIDPAVGREAW